MTSVDAANKIVTVSNAKIHVELTYRGGLAVNRFAHQSLNPGRILSGPQRELFTLTIEGKEYRSSDFTATEVSEADDGSQEMVSLLLQAEGTGLSSRVCLIGNPDGTMQLIVQLAANWKDGCPKEVSLHIPFLARFSLGCQGEEEYRFPASPAAKTDGSGIVQLRDDFRLPLCILEKRSGKGFCIQFPVVCGGLVKIWDQNRNHDLCAISSMEELRSHNLPLRPGQTFSDIFEMKFTAVEGGWPECFLRWKEEMRKDLDLQQYERADLRWYRDTFLHHFTFLYGREAFDYESGEADIGRLLEQGEESGGYDAVLLWHQYPRLGVDQRNQWEFFNDFPGGRGGLAKAAGVAHRKGVKVFLPFKPWDIESGEPAQAVASRMAELIRDTDADGIFFDTMSNVPDGFREAIDGVKPGVAFCTEAQPGDKRDLELITGSWAQYGGRNPMPEVNLLRFVLSEHFSPVIDRWSVGVKKDLLIKRAVFNATGIVVWQDVFGCWLPYSCEQKRMIGKWKEILTANKEILFGSNPVPLYPSLQGGVHCNRFSSDSANAVIYIVFNETGERVSGELFLHQPSCPTMAKELWKGAELQMLPRDGGQIVCGSIDAGDLLVVKLTENE